MNRRKLFGWLAALPFIPAALVAKPAATGLTAAMVRRAKAILTANAVPEPYYLHTHEGLWVVGDRTTEFWTYDGFMSKEIPRYVDPAINMKYRPNLPEWF